MVRRKTKRHAKWITRLVWRKRVVTDNIAAVYRNVTVPVRSCRPSNRGEDYTLDWNAMEPVLIREAPHATRVYGEASPIGVQLLEDGLAAHPVGVQVVAFHCYDTSIPGSGLTAVPALSRLVSGYGLPLWCSEMTPAIHPHFAGHRDRRAIQRESFMGAVGVAQRPDDRQLRLAELLRHAPPPA
jgi:hypothetical protein